MKKLYSSLLVFSVLSLAATAQTTTFSENFASVPTMLATGGWTEINHSDPVGPEIWHDGFNLAASTGAGVTSDSNFAEVSFQSTSTTANGDISNWLISPAITINNGDVVSFFTTSFNNLAFPDRLELRLNPMNNTNVGTLAADVGDFTILLTSVNPNLLADTAYYPQDYWGQFFATVSGLSGATTCRIALRYFVIDGGWTGLNSSTIGVDSLSITSIVGIPAVTTFQTSVYPNPAAHALYLTFAQPLAEKCQAGVYNAMGQLVLSFQLEKGQMSKKLDVSMLAKGMYSVTLLGNETTSRNTFLKN